MGVGGLVNHVNAINSIKQATKELLLVSCSFTLRIDCGYYHVMFLKVRLSWVHADMFLFTLRHRVQQFTLHGVGNHVSRVF